LTRVQSETVGLSVAGLRITAIELVADIAGDSHTAWSPVAHPTIAISSSSSRVSVAGLPRPSVRSKAATRLFIVGSRVHVRREKTPDRPWVPGARERVCLTSHPDERGPELNIIWHPDFVLDMATAGGVPEPAA
jgi:hypothetical protein